jgi:tetratricopeptide (TPR) repeat protein
MPFIFIFLTALLTSCAHRQGDYRLGLDNQDALRLESLKRYNNERLSNSKYSESPIVHCHKMEYNKAYDKFKEQLDQQKDNPLYWNHIATCYLLEEKLSQAKFYFDLALTLATNDKKNQALIMNNLGLYYSKINDSYAAKEAFEASIKSYAHYLTPHYNLAQLYLKYSQFTKAEQKLLMLYKTAPEDIDVIYGLGHLNLMQGQYSKANYYFEKIPQEHLDRDDIATNYALSLHLNNENHKSYKIVKNARMKDPFYLFAQTELIKKIERQQP